MLKQSKSLKTIKNSNRDTINRTILFVLFFLHIISQRGFEDLEHIEVVATDRKSETTIMIMIMAFDMLMYKRTKDYANPFLLTCHTLVDVFYGLNS